MTRALPASGGNPVPVPVPVQVPVPVLEMLHGRREWPNDAADWCNTPDWAKPLLEAALTPPV